MSVASYTSHISVLFVPKDMLYRKRRKNWRRGKSETYKKSRFEEQKVRNIII